jgi:hypothetical protein
MNKRRLKETQLRGMADNPLTELHGQMVAHG